MKELLLETKDGEYIYSNSEMDTVPYHVGVIEIPKDALALTKVDDILLFWFDHGFCCEMDLRIYNAYHSSFINYLEDIEGSICLWQRDSVEEKKEDDVNSPSHYNKGGVECIDAIESSMTKEAFCGYLKGNVIKYMYRYENKGGVESLKKAQWYLNKLINLESV